MAQQVIDIGAAPNDKTGDSLRVGGAKINANFGEIYTLLSDLTEVAFSGDYNDLVNLPTIPSVTGDVSGPVASTDGEVSVFDGTSGKTIKGGGVLKNAAFKDVGISGDDVAAGNRGLPLGGTAGQVLAKSGSGNYAVEWTDAGSGSGDGDVNGPDGGVEDSHAVLFDGNTGKLIKSGGPLAAVAFSGDYEDLDNLPASTGDVTGPEDSVANEVALFDGTTGKIIKGGGVLGNPAFASFGTGETDVAPGNRAVPSGGTTNQVLAKVSSDDYEVQWVDQTGGGGGGGEGDVTGPDGDVTDGQIVLFDGTTGKAIKGGNPLGAGAYASFGSGEGEIAEGNHTHSLASETENGFISSEDKIKIDGVVEGAQPNPDEASQAEAESGEGEEIRSWSPERVKQSVVFNAPIAIGGYMDNQSLFYKDVEGELGSLLALPAETLSFEKFAAGDTPVIITTEGLKTISTPKGHVVDNGVVEILWDSVDSSLNILISLEEGEDDVELRVQEVSATENHANLRGARLLVQLNNVDGAEKVVSLGTASGFVPVLIRPGFEAPLSFSGAGSKLFLTGLIGLDGTFIWMDSTIPEAP